MAAANCHNGSTMIMRGHEQITTLKGGTQEGGWESSPQIFEVFEVMKKELGGRAPPRKKIFIEKEKRISALFERFKE